MVKEDNLNDRTRLHQLVIIILHYIGIFYLYFASLSVLIDISVTHYNLNYLIISNNKIALSISLLHSLHVVLVYTMYIVYVHYEVYTMMNDGFLLLVLFVFFFYLFGCFLLYYFMSVILSSSIIIIFF